MAGLRIHTVMASDLVERIDAAASAASVSRGEFVRRAVERALEPKWTPPSGGRNVGRRAAEPEVHPEAVEQALGSSGRAGVRGRVPAPPPAEQPWRPVRSGEAPDKPLAGLPRVRSSSEARPFRPAPKRGK